MSGNTQQYDIFRHNKCNFHLVVCEISTFHMSNVTKVMNLRIMGPTGLTLSNNKFTHKQAQKQAPEYRPSLEGLYTHHESLLFEFHA